MKLFLVSRKQILRAIHAAMVAVFLAAAATAHAQTAIGSNGNVTVSGQGNTSFSFGTTSTPPLASGGTLTITAGTNDSVSTGSNSNIYAMQVQVPSTTTNSGYLSAYNGNNFSGGPATTLDISPTTTGGNVTVQNTNAGTITASTYMGSATAIDVENVQQGSISITNNGVILVQAAPNSGAANLTGIFANDSYATGSISLNNTGTISTGVGSTASAYGANLTTSGSGAMTVSNSGTITLSAYESEGSNVAGLYLTSTGSGAILVNNTNTISASGYVSNAAAAINANATGTGAISIMNSAALSGTNTHGGAGGFGIEATTSGTGAVFIQNSGSLSASGGTGYSINATAGTGSLTVSNSGALTASGYSTAGIAANGAAAVSVTNTADGTTQSNGAQSTGITASSTNGNANINNAAALTVSGMYSSAGIQISGATATLTNSGTLISQGRDETTTLGINASSTVGTLMVTNSGAITASGNYVPATDILMQGTGNTTLITTGTQVLTATAHYDGVGYTIGESVASSAGSVTVSNQQGILLNGDSATGIQGTSQTGTTIGNSGSISASGYGLTYGVQATAIAGNVSSTNSGYIMSTSQAGPGYGISGNVTTSGNVSLANTGQIVVTSNGNAYGLAADSSAGNGSASITNGSGATVSANSNGFSQSSYGAFIHAGGAADLTNNGSISASGSQASLTFGASVTSPGDITITNNASGNISDLGNFGNGTGINATQTGTGTITIANHGTVSAMETPTEGAAFNTYSGIYANNTGAGGSIVIGNTGTVTSNSSYGNSNGIAAVSNGPITINNSGTVSSVSGYYQAQVGVGYGISANAGGSALTVNNSGSATGTTSGIYLGSVGTVNNSGLASGGTYSIQVQSGSTVNLTGNSSINGLLKGGANDNSNSLLNFQISVRLNYAATKANLDAAIADYEAQYPVVGSNGADVTSAVVVINSSDYQWQDFRFVEDNLVQGRLYENYAGFRSLGTALDYLNPNNPNAANLLSSLDALPDSAVINALSELSPKELEVFRHVAFDNNTFNAANVNNHLANLRDGLTGFDSSELTVQDSGMDSTLNEVRSHLLAYNPSDTPGLVNDSASSILGTFDSKDMKSAAVNTMPTDRWSSFISGDVILADTSHNVDLPDADYTTGNVTGGVDYRLNKHFTIGALLSYAHTDANLDNRGSSATVDSYSPGIYASYVDGGWYGNGLGAYTRNTYTEDREIDIPGLAGDNHGGASGNQGSVDFTGGYEFQRGNFKFGPVASVQYVHLSIDSISEQGPTALDIASQDQDSFRSLLGVEGRFSTTVATSFGRMILTPHVSANWQHEYLDNSQGMNAAFNGTGGGSFTVNTDSPDRDSAFVDVGLDATVSKNVTLFIDYEAQAGQDDFFAQSARGGVKIGF
jgi:fibronectin-binding autotransporter adhesin